MNITKYITLLIVVLFSAIVKAQSSDPIVAKVGSENITKAELEYAYNKSIKNSISEKQTLEQFLQSYINFKLKVEEAKRLGLDKNPLFKSEYTQYTKDLEKSYMEDTVTMPHFAKMIYERLHENIEVSHLFIAFPNKNVFPKDTLATYQKIKDIRSKVSADGRNFTDLIKKYSNDTISLKAKNQGSLGWVTTFSTGYTFEESIYNNPINTLSEPVRSNYGYHLIKILNKRADQGQIKISHILVKYPQEHPTQAEIDNGQKQADKIYKELLAGGNFKELCNQYSDDKATSKYGGEIGWFGVRSPLPDNFATALKDVPEGGFSKPLKTDYGFHVFRVEEKISMDSWAQMKKDIISYLGEGDRRDIIRSMELARISKEVPYQIEATSYQKLEQLAQQYQPIDSLYTEKADVFSKDILLRSSDKEYTVGHFLDFLKQNRYYMFTLSTDVLTHAVDNYTLKTLKEIKKEKLYQLYPELKYISREYYEGILLFDVMNKEVWEKAQTDKKALEDLYNQNPNKYTWDSPRYDGYLIYLKNKEMLDKAQQIIKEQNNPSTNLFTILKEQLNTNGEQNVIIEKGFWGKGDNEYVDHILYKTPTNKELVDYPEYFLEGKLIQNPRNMEDVRGQVVSDYQIVLEKQWLESLRKKYKVEINKEALK